MRYRALDANGDHEFGKSVSDFLVNTPATVAQAVRTRLALDFGEWFLDTTDGTKWNTSVLGKYTRSLRDAEIRARVLDTPGVTGIARYESAFDDQTRRFLVDVTIDTLYGQATVAGPI